MALDHWAFPLKYARSVIKLARKRHIGGIACVPFFRYDFPMNTYYHKCTRCGANLDPGEHCECEKNNVGEMERKSAKEKNRRLCCEGLCLCNRSKLG